jgi:hypothetical protein
LVFDVEEPLEHKQIGFWCKGGVRGLLK